MNNPPPELTKDYQNRHRNKGADSWLAICTFRYGSTLHRNCYQYTKRILSIITPFIDGFILPCIYASGSSLRTIFSFTKLILVTALHFGQNRGKPTSVVSSRTLVLVFPLHTGHGSQYSFRFVFDMTFSLFHSGSTSCVRLCE